MYLGRQDHRVLPFYLTSHLEAQVTKYPQYTFNDTDRTIVDDITNTCNFRTANIYKDPV